MPVDSPEKQVKIVSKFKIIDQVLDGSFLLQFVFVTIPEVMLDVIYKLVHIGQHEDLLKTHLQQHQEENNQAGSAYMHWSHNSATY